MCANTDERIECAFLVPQTDDWMKAKLSVVRDLLLGKFGGFSEETTLVHGLWRDDDGIVHEDWSRRFGCAVHPARVGELRSIVREVCVAFQQQCVYFNVAGHVEFIAPFGSK